MSGRFSARPWALCILITAVGLGSCFQRDCGSGTTGASDPPPLVDAKAPVASRGSGEGSASTHPPDARDRALLVEELFVSPSSYAFERNPRLLDRILGGPHGYFRFINVAFSQAICRRFKAVVGEAPNVNLHGDAHLEQYAVTDIGRGLTDFDDSSKGPVVLDILRFGVSIRLALRMHAPDTSCDPFFERFLAGYREALEEPSTSAPEPDWVGEIRARFVDDRAQYFEWISKIMLPVPEGQTDALRAALKNYVRAMLQKYPELPPRFFDVQKIGFLTMGIGSALDEKYLIRVRGPTDDPLDDVILEVKEVRSLNGIECIEGADQKDPFRILLSQSRIAYKPYGYLGYIDFRDKKFWIHSWVDNYRELRLENLARRPEALAQVAYDVGVQLGRGHPKIAGEFEIQLRQAQLEFLKLHSDDLRRAIYELSDATVEAWKLFRAAVPR